jgi:hypothetical protein
MKTKKIKKRFILLVQPKDKAAYIQPGSYETEQDAIKSAQGYAISEEVLFSVYTLLENFEHYHNGWLRKTSYQFGPRPERPFNKV